VANLYAVHIRNRVQFTGRKYPDLDARIARTWALIRGCVGGEKREQEDRCHVIHV
jgi:hypothetical protein